jgi:membrane-bound lytic murein transglycosylase D
MVMTQERKNSLCIRLKQFQHSLFRGLMSIIFLTLLQGVYSQAPSATAPFVSETLIKNRLEELNRHTLIPLTYNRSVKAYIDVYTVQRRAHLSQIIGRTSLYFPIFEEYLAKYNLPQELKYLAIVESALDPRAKSSSGAMGLWQFLYHASRMFDLRVTTYLDERCDPYKSTDAACRYLDYLYRNFNDWHLALAAYNTGVGEVKKAMERSGKTNYWELQSYLPKGAQGYVAAFIAANYAMDSYTKHGIIPQKPLYTFHDVDTVIVNKNLTVEQICKAIDLPIEHFHFLNPVFTKDLIPASTEPIHICLPANKIAIFLREEKKLSTSPSKQTQLVKPVTTEGRQLITHTVLPGEFFHKIAIRYHCRVEDIVAWNNMKHQNLFAGQKLRIWAPDTTSRYFFIREVALQYLMEDHLLPGVTAQVQKKPSGSGF